MTGRAFSVSTLSIWETTPTFPVCPPIVCSPMVAETLRPCRRPVTWAMLIPLAAMRAGSSFTDTCGEVLPYNETLETPSIF
ncbi:hypothetical protein D3C71_1769060 [compost metagenome]